MKKRVFVTPTAEEIEERKKMYDEAAELGIDLMSFDSDEKANSEDVRRAIYLLGTGQTIPEALRKRILEEKTKKTVNIATNK